MNLANPGPSSEKLLVACPAAQPAARSNAATVKNVILLVFILLLRSERIGRDYNLDRTDVRDNPSELVR
jgi:hypothetical protein